MEITPKAMEIEYIRIKRFNLEREKAYATGTDAIHCCLIPLAGYYFFSVSPPFGLHGSGKIEPVKKWLSGNFWLVSFKISYLCLPLFHETRTTPSCHPSGCAYRQL